MLICTFSFSAQTLTCCPSFPLQFLVVKSPFLGGTSLFFDLLLIRASTAKLYVEQLEYLDLHLPSRLSPISLYLPDRDVPAGNERSYKLARHRSARATRLRSKVLRAFDCRRQSTCCRVPGEFSGYSHIYVLRNLNPSLERHA